MQAIRTPAMGIVVLLALWPQPVASEDRISGAEVLTHLAGTWNAEQQRTPRSTAIDEQVFGRGALDVRDVVMVVHPTGEGDLKIHKSVVGRTGHVYAPSLLDVKFRISEPVTAASNAISPTVSVVSADQQYLDGDHEHWQRDGSRLTLDLVGLTGNQLNVQFDTPDGRDGFGATLTRRP